MNTLLIIDGNCLLFQMFYGMPSKIYNKSGQTIHATIGFVSYVLKQIKLTNATHVAVVFDRDSSSERKQQLDTYKANRPTNWDELDPSEVPFNEEQNITTCLNYLGINVLYSCNMEADDVICSLTKLFDTETKVIISSFDSDFFQLINNNVTVIRYRGKNSITWDKTYFVNHFGFDPNKYALYKSIVGDNSDNIEGAPTIGKVRASNVVKVLSCCSTDNLTKNLTEADLPAHVKTTLLENVTLIERNYKLIKLEYKAEVQYNIDDFVFDKKKAQLTNSQVLSACKVFD